jgi:hypothetical protein
VRHRNQHVLDAVHLAVDAGLLEGAQQPQPGDLLDPEGRDFLVFEADRAAVDGVIADDRVEQRRLA